MEKFLKALFMLIIVLVELGIGYVIFKVLPEAFTYIFGVLCVIIDIPLVESLDE